MRVSSPFPIKFSNFVIRRTKIHIVQQKSTIILAIESSCDDTSAAILKNETILSNEIATQKVHQEYGGVVPELASRAHLKNIVPVVKVALKKAEIDLEDLDAIAFTKGPGLLGSLVVGTSFAKSLALGLNKPLIDVNHMHAHILAHFIDDEDKKKPNFPFLCLTVSGGHTQIVEVKSPLEMKQLGTTIDDAAGEAFDKIAKIIGFPYPGGPLIDKYAQKGNPDAFTFGKPKLDGLNFSFSGLKTSVLYFIQKQERENPNFVQEHLTDLCASVQKAILDVLLRRLKIAVKQTQISEVAIAGGVSANSGLRRVLLEMEAKHGWTVHIPKFEYCTDNAGMIAIAGKFLFEAGKFTDQSVSAQARISFDTI